MKGIRPNKKRKLLKFKRYQKKLSKKKKHSSIKKRMHYSSKRKISPKKENKIFQAQPMQIKRRLDPNMTYSDASKERVIGFKDIYPEIEPPTIISLLEDIPREDIIKISQVLINLYKDSDFNGIQKFFSPSNKILKEDFNKRF